MRTSIFLMLIIIISKITGFVRDTSIAYIYGTSINVDAYFISTTIPAVIFGVIGSGITTTLLPMFVREEKENGPEATNKYLNIVISNVAIAVLFVILVGILSSKLIVKMVAPGFSGDAYNLSVILTMIGFPSIFFTSLGAVCTAKLQSMNKFMAPSIIGITANVVLVLYLFLFNTGFGVKGFMVATVISYMTEIMVMMPVLYKSGWRFKFSVDFKHPLFKKMVFLTLPVLIGTTVDQINVLVDRMLASGLGEGSVSALNYAYRLNALVTSLFAYSVGAVIYYATSHAGAEKDYVKLQRQLYVGLELIIVISIPIAVGIFTFNEAIVKTVFERGTFTHEGTLLTSSALMFYSIGIIGIMARDLLSRTFYSLQETRTPMKNGIVAVLLNITLSLILVNFMQIGGLALASSLSLNFSGIILYFLLNRKIKFTFHKKVAFSLLKALVAAAVMILPAKLLFGLLGGNGMLALIVAVLTAAIIYLVMIFLLKFDIIDALKEKIRARFKGNKTAMKGVE